MKNWQADCHALLACSSKTDLLTKLKVLAAKLEFDDVSLAMEVRLPAAAPTLTMLSANLSDWQQHYVRSGYAAIDPRVCHARTTRLPHAWDAETIRNAPQHFYDDWQANGPKAGWTLPIHDAASSAAITFLREDTPMSQPELSAHVGSLMLVATYAHQALQPFAFAPFQPEHNETLTVREIAVLRWAAEGKTVGDTGDLLGLSEDAIKFHRKAAIRKMRAANITEATVKAFALGLLI